jgi:broad specificity phosphatase PhoE
VDPAPTLPQKGWWGRWGCPLVIVCCVIVIFVAWANQPLTVVLVRHAEKAAEPADDPPLTADGTARAQALVDVLGDAGVDAIFVSSLIRTGLTAEPLATAEGLTPITVPIDENDPQPYVTNLLDQLLSGHWGDTLLVVSHSHTVPMIADQLGAPATGAIGNSFDKFFTITVPRWWGTPTIVRARYGAAN